MTKRFFFVAALVIGCSGNSSEAPPKSPTFEYSHTIAGIETPECLELRSTCDDVALLCEGAKELSSVCHDVADQSTDAYALPGASEVPGRPFGVGSCIELESC